MAYEDFKDLTRRGASGKILRDKAFNIAENLKCDGYQRGLALMVYNCFDKKNVSRSVVENENMTKYELLKNYTNQLLQNLKK